jgi:N utilization substance protein A
MGKIRLDIEELRYMALFENITGAIVKDCIENIEKNGLIFVVKSGDMGLAIGKGGENINRMKMTVDKHIELVEDSENPVDFIKNAFRPISIKNVNIIQRGDKRIAYVDIPAGDKGLAIGKGGKNIEKVKKLSLRHHNIEDIIIQ